MISKTLTPGASLSTSTGPSVVAGQSTMTWSEVTTGTSFDGGVSQCTLDIWAPFLIHAAAIATLAGKEDEANDEAVQDGIQDILSHPIISLCGAGQDEENVLKSYLGMEQPLPMDAAKK
ncbi:hypothetical protein OPQ81_008896 [Rhizoctonia solani]|nr:hypothetical protein OPQ81_008896 [Rhizoctonia solani]